MGIASNQVVVRLLAILTSGFYINGSCIILFRGVLNMFNFLNNDYELQPRTYSIKSYRRRESSIGKKMARLLVWLVILIILGVAAFLFFY